MADNTILTKIKAYFTTAASRENLTSGEELQTSLGKVKKWFSDLGTAAFTNSTDYAASSHNQASNTINAMTGYTKPQATSAITASDTLNQAIGKLEKGLEDAGGGGDLEDHIATNVEDDGGVHGIRCYNGKLEVYNDYSQEWCDPSEIGVAVGNVSNLTIGQGNLSLTLNWSDPADTTDATWKGTKVVMKVGSYPESVTDGQLVCDNQVRNNYSTAGLTINNLTEGTTYYFQLFPYTTTGAVTIDDSNRISGIAVYVYKLGLRADFVNSTFTRLGDAAGLSGGNDFDNFPMYKRRRCNLANDGTVNAYLGDASFAVDGSNGQVMVEQPKFYYKIVPVTLNASDNKQLDVAEYWVSNSPLPGYKLHPAFKDTSGNEIDYFYEGAYEGAYVYSSGNQILASVSGVTPLHGQSSIYYRSEVRNRAAARGTGWYQETIWSLSADQILMIIEYGMFNMQSAIGNGNSYSSSFLTTGTLNAYGNGTYGKTDDKQTAVQWRGKENPWANYSTWVDGINFNGYVPYIANSYNFSDGTSVGYNQIGFDISSAGYDYIGRFGYDVNFDWIFLPYSSIHGDSSIPIGDKFYSNASGWHGVRTGGERGGDQAAGIFWTETNYNANSYGDYRSARLLYVG